MQLILVVNCSSKKTAPIDRGLRASGLARAALPELAAEWNARVARGTSRLRADNLYNGRAFALAKEIAELAKADLHIASAGMGLIRRDALIPAYNLSVTPGTKDCILGRAIAGSEFSAQQWWRAVQPRVSPWPPIDALIRGRPDALAVIAATGPYVNMVADEIAGLDDAILNRVRIVGIKEPASLPQRLQSFVMPYDARLNDANLPVRGTEFDYPARALTHFVNLVRHDSRIEPVKDHAQRVRQSLAPYSAPRPITHQRIGDELLRRHIQAFKRQGLSKSAALDTLRHGMELACEQSRFSRAWATVEANKYD